MKKFRAVNITEQFDLPSSISEVKTTWVQDYSQWDWGCEFSVDPTIKTLYTVPQGVTARIMVAYVVPSEANVRLKGEFVASDGTNKPFNEGLSTYNSIKINDSSLTRKSPFIIGSGGDTRRERLYYENSGQQYELKTYKDIPIYLKAGDTLYARSQYYQTVEATRNNLPQPSLNIFDTSYVADNTSMIYFSILEEYDE